MPLSVSETILHWMLRWLVNDERWSVKFGKNSLWSCHVLACAWRDWARPQTSSVITTCVEANILTKHLQCKSRPLSPHQPAWSWWTCEGSYWQITYWWWLWFRQRWLNVMKMIMVNLYLKSATRNNKNLSVGKEQLWNTHTVKPVKL